MATTYTWTYTDIDTVNGSYIIDNNNVTVKAIGRNITITPPTSTISLKSNVSGTVKYLVQPRRLTYTKDDGTSAYKTVGSEFLSASVAQGTKVAFPSSSVTLYADDLFSEENPTEAYKDCQLKFPSSTSIIGTTIVYTGSGIARGGGPQNQITVGTIRVLLDVPPTATVSTLSFDTPYIYAGLTTASVTVSDTTAYYGGNIDSVTLTIGNQTASISGDGTLSILLNAGGTFTPVVTITDSRGQTKDYPLDPIMVGTYSTPTVNFDAQRTDVNGKIADEGEYATIVTTLTFDPIAEAVAPSVSVTDEDGNAQTIDSITWYSTRASDGALSGAVTWSTLPSGSTVYGLISITGDFNTQKSYVIELTPQDSEGITGDTKTDTLQTAFYTVDFLAGGHGIAFGQPATQDGFFCNMQASFVDANDVMRALFDFIHPVGSYYETSDTTFDPNVTWGGTWSLETEGQVHISAGANYTVAGALTDTTDGGEATHLLTSAESALPEHNHTFDDNVGAWTTPMSVTGPSRHTIGSGSGAANMIRSANAITRYPSIGNKEIATASDAHNNMQPYIIVNRWHRTA